jgi:hypothetical protein
MKSTIRNLIAAVFVVGIVTSVSAAPPGKGPLSIKTYKEAATQAEIESLKPGERYALVCMECKSITVKEITDEKEAKALCHEGGYLHCDSCKKKFTIKYLGPPGKETTTSKVTIVNEKGEQCMFIVTIKE